MCLTVIAQDIGFARLSKALEFITMVNISKYGDFKILTIPFLVLIYAPYWLYVYSVGKSGTRIILNFFLVFAYFILFYMICFFAGAVFIFGAIFITGGRLG
jgi:hypothetical protein